MTLIIACLLFVLVIAVADHTIRFSRLVKPLRNLAEELPSESRRIRLELTKMADEISLIRKARPDKPTGASSDSEVLSL